MTDSPRGSKHLLISKALIAGVLAYPRVKGVADHGNWWERCFPGARRRRSASSSSTASAESKPAARQSFHDHWRKYDASFSRPR